MPGCRGSLRCFSLDDSSNNQRCQLVGFPRSKLRWGCLLSTYPEVVTKLNVVAESHGVAVWPGVQFVLSKN